MLDLAIKTLIFEEQARQSNRFVDGTDLDAYCHKLGERAEILADTQAGQCRGFIAFYCNDFSSRQAYITLVLIDPEHRGTGLGRTLVEAVLAVARRRGFATCRLEVRRSNDAAFAMYQSLGFRVVDDRREKYLLEVDLVTPE